MRISPGTDETTTAFRACEQIAQHHARSFYFASRVLPGDKRKAAYALYAFCRTADNIADEAGQSRDAAHALEQLRHLRTQLHAVYGDGSLADPVLLALRDTVKHYRIPKSYFLDLLRGAEMDLAITRYEEFAQLEEYCYCVASVVGLMMTHILGVSDPAALQHARELGTAMQLTNILRDLREDHGRGRIYLPQAELREFGYSEDDLRRGVVNDNFRALMRFQVERARSLYRSAAAGIPALTDDGSRFCVRLMSRIYSSILDAIEVRAYDVFSQRAYVSFSTKVWILLRSAVAWEKREFSVQPGGVVNAGDLGVQEGISQSPSVIEGK